MMSVPLQVGGRTIGVVYLDSNKAEGTFFQADVATIEALAAQAAVAIESARLYEDLRGKNELIGMLAHELRTPLTAILGFAEILEKIPTLTTEQRDRYLGAVQDHGDRMGRLIQQVLVLARLGVDRVEWAFRPVELDALVVQTVVGLEPIAAARGVRLIVQVDGTLPRVAGDPDRLVQVLSNLISNAVSVSDTGSAVTITVRTATMASGPTHRPVVEIRVRDEGPGISASDLPTLFEPFLGTGKRPDGGGAGLGLHICQTIVQRHGGCIWMETVPGGGSAFVFQIPTAAD